MRANLAFIFTFIHFAKATLLHFRYNKSKELYYVINNLQKYPIFTIFTVSCVTYFTEAALITAIIIMLHLLRTEEEEEEEEGKMPGAIFTYSE